MSHTWWTQGGSCTLLTVATTTAISTISTENRVVGNYRETPLQLRPGRLGQVGDLTDGSGQPGAHQPCHLHPPSRLVGVHLRPRKHDWSSLFDYFGQFTLPKYWIPQLATYIKYVSCIFKLIEKILIIFK